MSENTPLQSKLSNSYDEENDLYEKKSKLSKLKLFLIILASALTIGTFYLFVIVLPSIFIPEAVELKEITRVGNINVELIPVSKQSNFNQLENSSLKPVERIILVGDIHGHYKEFKKLLKKLKFNKKTDYLLVLGDFISKGPDSFKVLEYLIDHDIDCIFGNHEYDILNYYAEFHHIESPKFNEKTLNSFNDDPDFLLAKKLKPKHVKYINNCSIIKKLWNHPLESSSNHPAGVGSGIAVHAGIRWDLPLEEQEPLDNLEMRYYIKPFYNQTSSEEDDDTVSWSKYYNRKQKELAESDQTMIFYGHDARNGLNIKALTKGLDTGCDKGNKLTGLVLSRRYHGGSIKLHKDLVHVKC